MITTRVVGLIKVRELANNLKDRYSEKNTKDYFRKKLRPSFESKLKQGVNSSLVEKFPKSKNARVKGYKNNTRGAVEIKPGGAGRGNLAFSIVVTDEEVAKYLPFREDGGTTGGHIYPKNAENLAIPTKYALKTFPRKLLKSPRNLQHLHTFLLKGTNIIAYNPGGSSEPKALFVLAKSVYLKPVHWAKDGVDMAVNGLQKEIESISTAFVTVKK